MWAKAKQHPEAELLTNMPKTQVCLYHLDYMINCNENKNDNGKIDHMNKTYIDQDVDIETNMENTVCLSKTVSLYYVISNT